MEPGTSQRSPSLDFVACCIELHLLADKLLKKIAYHHRIEPTQYTTAMHRLLSILCVANSVLVSVYGLSMNRSNELNRRKVLKTASTSFLIAANTGMVFTSTPKLVLAYEPDPDPLRESLYLVSRVQEATVQQERFVRKATDQQALKNKMKLTLLLILSQTVMQLLNSKISTLKEMLGVMKEEIL